MIFSYLLNMQSHPSWVCGLKLNSPNLSLFPLLSHPSWVCGLKLGNMNINGTNVLSHPSWVCGLKLLFLMFSFAMVMSHPSWVCGLKQRLPMVICKNTFVTPFVGVWIETNTNLTHTDTGYSHTLRGCVD